MMRSIVYIKGDKAGIGEQGLEHCSLYTPLVETQAGEGVYLDITGCGKAEKIVFSLAERLATTGVKWRMGWAGSRLLAKVAIERNLLSLQDKGRLYRTYKIGKGIIIEVLPGCERAFLDQLPLEEFPPLRPPELKKLSRAAFAVVGDIARQSHETLALLLGKRAASVLEKSQGIDDDPVLGFYPPQQLALPLQVEGPLGEGVRLEQQFGYAAFTLERLLEERRAGAGQVCLEVFGEQMISRKRRLSRPCFQAQMLKNILLGLWEQMPVLQSPWQGRVLLKGLTALNWQQQDLFALHIKERQQSRLLLQQTLCSLKMRFPEQISLGQKVGRREQALALWDPWRFQSGALGSGRLNENPAVGDEVN